MIPEISPMGVCQVHAEGELVHFEDRPDFVEALFSEEGQFQQLLGGMRDQVAQSLDASEEKTIFGADAELIVSDGRGELLLGGPEHRCYPEGILDTHPSIWQASAHLAVGTQRTPPPIRTLGNFMFTFTRMGNRKGHHVLLIS